MSGRPPSTTVSIPISSYGYDFLVTALTLHYPTPLLFLINDRLEALSESCAFF